jgi:hypothetical protein
MYKVKKVFNNEMMTWRELQDLNIEQRKKTIVKNNKNWDHFLDILFL